MCFNEIEPDEFPNNWFRFGMQSFRKTNFVSYGFISSNWNEPENFSELEFVIMYSIFPHWFRIGPLTKDKKQKKVFH